MYKSLQPCEAIAKLRYFQLVRGRVSNLHVVYPEPQVVIIITHRAWELKATRSSTEYATEIRTASFLSVE